MVASVSASRASETEMPSRTSAAACLRFSGVIRFSVPRSSSAPHRPQFVSSPFHRSTSACVTRCPLAAGAVPGWKPGGRTVCPSNGTTTPASAMTAARLGRLLVVPIGPSLVSLRGRSQLAPSSPRRRAQQTTNCGIRRKWRSAVQSNRSCWTARAAIQRSFVDIGRPSPRSCRCNRA